MAPTQKRKSESLSKASKRTKISPKIYTDQPHKKASTAPPTRTKSKSWKPAKLDALNWREVTMPDVLDDVEGFMGLEEVDDVQVVNSTGIIEYQVTGNAASVPGSEGGVIEDEEWNGFGDDEKAVVEPGVVVPAPTKREKKDEKLNEKQLKAQAKKEKQRLKKKEDKKESKKLKKTLEKASIDNPFGVLDEEIEDEDAVESLPEWENLFLSRPTLQALSKMKFKAPTPIQSSSIPHILDGHDVIGKASTGSGKTLAFAIPIFEYWQTYHQSSAKDRLSGEEAPKIKDEETKFTHSPTALILAPTRELAHQISEHIVQMTSSSGLTTPPTTVTVTGGLSLQKQTRQLMQFGGADIVVATPGRLWEVLREGKGFVNWISRVKFMVVDEADRVLQEGHFQEVEEVLNLLRRGDAEGESDSDDGNDEASAKKKKTLTKVDRQMLVFSATFSKELQQKLAGKLSLKSIQSGLMGDKESLEFLLRKLPFRETEPKWVDVNPVAQMAARLREGIVECGNMEKDLYLYYLLCRFPIRTLIFTNSISTVRRLAPFLQNLQLPAHALHSAMIQKARLRNLERFSTTATGTRPSILISTDVAARGLDIKDIDLIIHYHVPRAADTYVHRSGRTARSTNTGVSIMLCSPEEVTGVRRLIGKIHEDRASLKKSIKMIPVDRTLVTRLRTRVDLAQRITSSSIAKDVQHKEKDWLKTAAEELGVDYSSDEFAAAAEKGRRGSQKRKAAREVTKDEMSEMRARLAHELKQMVGKGSRTYITSGRGGENLAQMLTEGKNHDIFFGEVDAGLEELL